jgi:hypothetical protein
MDGSGNTDFSGQHLQDAVVQSSGDFFPQCPDQLEEELSHDDSPTIFGFCGMPCLDGMLG